ncbi:MULTISPECIES: NAD(P)/FAD-dependent oxidoreductase [unclassified Empedobacter]|uniref:NAD(P)/FAD-dependent oxidoreductase n=1 Tax=unclassified Empedobacter TaxID=2643773 RepID=UPI002575F04D|nr:MULTISPECIES: FAD-dependent oxidoreductase [unclassified Empedobacter]MDM1137422.1 FAD-dependent oxidoreductase [Empedobacter sp. R132-2]
MKKVEYIIVGQGVAGSCMAMKLLKEKKSFVIIDNHFHKASAIAAGIFNSVVLKRFSIVWNATKQIERLREVFGYFEQLLNKKYIYNFPVYRIFNDEQEKKTWLKKATTHPDLIDYLATDTEQLNDFSSINSPIGSGEVLHTGRVDLTNLLADFKDYLVENDAFLDETFDFNELKLEDNQTSYKKIEATKIIFAEGYNILNNPYFKNLPIIGVKGEVLRIKTEANLPEAVVKGKEFLMPLENNQYFVGATYDRDYVNYKNTEDAKQYLVEGVQNFFKDDFEVVEQHASIRPTVVDRRPIIGVHPTHQQLICLNGMGTRGTMLAPVMVDDLYDFLENNQPIDKEANIARFYDRF